MTTATATYYRATVSVDAAFASVTPVVSAGNRVEITRDVQTATSEQLRQDVRIRTPNLHDTYDVTQWLLRTGAWDDGGIWTDGATWEDDPGPLDTTPVRNANYLVTLFQLPVQFQLNTPHLPDISVVDDLVWGVDDLVWSGEQLVWTA